MIPSRPLDLGGIIGETIRIVKQIYWRAALFLLIFTLPGLLILTYGTSMSIDGLEEVAQKFSSASPEAPTLVRDYFLAGKGSDGSMWFYRLQYPEVFTVIDSVKRTIDSRYPDSAQARILDRLDSVTNCVTAESGKSWGGMFFSSLSTGLIILCIGFLLYVFGIAAVWGAIFDLSSRAFEERPFIFGAIVRLSLTRSLWLLIIQYILIFFAMITGLGIVVGITVIISPVLGIFGILASMVILIYSLIRIMFCGISLVSEGSGPIESVKRSLALTQDMFWRVLGISCIVGVLIYIITTLIRLPLSLAVSADLDWVIEFIRGNASIPLFFNGLKETLEKLMISGFISTLLTISFFPAFLTTFYYDLRTRKEGELDYISESETEN